MEDYKETLLGICLGFCTISCGYTIWKLNEITDVLEGIQSMIMFP